MDMNRAIEVRLEWHPGAERGWVVNVMNNGCEVRHMVGHAHFSDAVAIAEMYVRHGLPSSVKRTEKP
jgi:hypothetical protein